MASLHNSKSWIKPHRSSVWTIRKTGAWDKPQRILYHHVDSALLSGQAVPAKMRRTKEGE